MTANVRVSRNSIEHAYRRRCSYACYHLYIARHTQQCNDDALHAVVLKATMALLHINAWDAMKQSW